MTLKDIAKEAGVSISTVSRIINGNSSNAASKEMQDKIWSTGMTTPVNFRRASKSGTGRRRPAIVPTKNKRQNGA